MPGGYRAFERLFHGGAALWSNAPMGTIVITGSASGIGRATSERIAADGHRVIGVDLHDAEVLADLSTAAGRASMVDEVTCASDGVIHGLLAGAGISGRTNESGRVLRINYFGAVATLVGLQPLLSRGAPASAVAISSNAATTQPGGADPSVVQLCLEGREDEASRGMTGVPAAGYAIASCARPGGCAATRWPPSGSAPASDSTHRAGIIVTPMTEAGLSSLFAMPDWPRPTAEPGRPEEVAGLVRYLLSDEARYFVGSFVVTDGGNDAGSGPTIGPPRADSARGPPVSGGGAGTRACRAPRRRRTRASGRPPREGGPIELGAAQFDHRRAEVVVGAHARTRSPRATSSTERRSSWRIASLSIVVANVHVCAAPTVHRPSERVDGHRAVAAHPEVQRRVDARREPERGHPTPADGFADDAGERGAQLTRREPHRRSLGAHDHVVTDLGEVVAVVGHAEPHTLDMTRERGRFAECVDARGSHDPASADRARTRSATTASPMPSGVVCSSSKFTRAGCRLLGTTATRSMPRRSTPMSPRRRRLGEAGVELRVHEARVGMVVVHVRDDAVGVHGERIGVGAVVGVERYPRHAAVPADVPHRFDVESPEPEITEPRVRRGRGVRIDEVGRAQRRRALGGHLAQRAQQGDAGERHRVVSGVHRGGHEHAGPPVDPQVLACSASSEMRVISCPSSSSTNNPHDARERVPVGSERGERGEPVRRRRACARPPCAWVQRWW